MAEQGEPERIAPPSELTRMLMDLIRADKTLFAPRTSPVMHTNPDQTRAVKFAIDRAFGTIANPDFFMPLADEAGLSMEPAEAVRRLNNLTFESGEGPSGAAMATTVGGDHVKILPDFSRIAGQNNYSLNEALIIHELLHTLGLTEKPHWPDAMTSQEITAMVRRHLRQKK